RTVTSDDTDPLVNTVVVTANPDGFPNVLTDTDDFSINLLHPGLNIDKSGPELSKIGDPVTYTYLVLNTGDTPLVNVVVVDDAGTSGDTGDDFNPDPVLNNGFNVGDINQDGILDPGETWQYTKTLTVPVGATDPFVNVATVTATLESDRDVEVALLIDSTV